METWKALILEKLVAKGLPPESLGDGDSFEEALCHLDYRDFWRVQNPVLKSYKDKGFSYQYAVAAAFPQFHLKPWDFLKVAQDFWKNPQHHQDFLLHVAYKKGWKTWGQFHGLTLNVVEENGGAGLLSSFYSNTPYNLLSAIFPQFPWKRWRLGKVPLGFWDDKANGRAFLAGVMESRKWTKEGLYQLTRKVAQEHGGGALYGPKYYKGSTLALLQDLMPEVEWLPWKLVHTPEGYWTNPNHIRLFLESVKKEKKWNNEWDFYKLTKKDLDTYGGTQLLNLYPSIVAILQDVYPHRTWYPWGMAVAPKHFWDAPNNHEDFIRFLAQYNRWTSHDLCRSQLKRSHIDQFGARALLSHYPGGIEAVKEALCHVVTGDLGPAIDVDFLENPAPHSSDIQ